MVAKTASPKMRRTTSPMPIGLTPGHLSNAISRQATNAVRPSGSIYVEHILLHMLAKELQRLAESSLNEVGT